MFTDDGLGFSCLEGGGPDALEHGAVVGDVGVAQDIVAELEFCRRAL